jgi:copper chaperone
VVENHQSFQRKDVEMKTILRSQELSCPSCVAKIEKALKNLDGVQEATVHFNTGRIEVEHDPERVKAETLVAAVKSAGYEARVSAF